MLRRLSPRASVVFLGDVVNKGPSSLGAVSLLRAHYEPRRWRLLWGNHDLLFVRAMSGSREAQLKLFSQRNGGLILAELGYPALLERAERCFSRLAEDGVAGERLARAVRRERSLCSSLDTAIAGHRGLQASLAWMKSVFRLYHLSDGVLYVHGGIPVTQKGMPRLTLAGLRRLEARVARSLSSAELDSPTFADLDVSEQSPLRIVKWVRSISSPKAFCKKLGVRAIVVGHSEIKLADIESDTFPIVRHDFGAAACKGGTPSLLEITPAREFVTHLRVNMRWRKIRRGVLSGER